MALSKEAIDMLIVALANRRIAKEVSSAIDRKAASVDNIALADATDLPSAEALANANKAKINEIIAALKAAGLMS